jgi:hypothetical protein
MGRTLSSNRRGETVRDLVEIVDPPCSEFNPSLDINETEAEGFRVLSSYSENFDGRVDMSPPFNLSNPNPLKLGTTERERTAPVRNDDPEGFRSQPRRARS